MSVSVHEASAHVHPVDVVPLGGLGEFGLNMMAISCGDTTILIDSGAMFPESDLPGVDPVRALAEAGIDPKRRPETLHLAEMAALATAFSRP